MVRDLHCSSLLLIAHDELSILISRSGVTGHLALSKEGLFLVSVATVRLRYLPLDSDAQ